jgi:hypothetical protein
MCEQYYQPAGCVLSCEQAGTSDPACSQELDALIACYRNTPSAVADNCRWDGKPKPCDAAALPLSACIQTQHFLRSPEGGSYR